MYFLYRILGFIIKCLYKSSVCLNRRFFFNVFVRADMFARYLSNFVFCISACLVLQQRCLLSTTPHLYLINSNYKLMTLIITCDCITKDNETSVMRFHLPHLMSYYKLQTFGNLYKSFIKSAISAHLTDVWLLPIQMGAIVIISIFYETFLATTNCLIIKYIFHENIHKKTFTKSTKPSAQKVRQFVVSFE